MTIVEFAQRQYWGTGHQMGQSIATGLRAELSIARNILARRIGYVGYGALANGSADQVGESDHAAIDEAVQLVPFFGPHMQPKLFSAAFVRMLVANRGHRFASVQ